MNFIKWLLTVSDESRSVLNIITWWEIRRIVYNIVGGIAGLISLVLFLYFVSHSGKVPPGEQILNPMVLLFLFVFLNLAYSAGAFVEVVLKLVAKSEHKKIGPLFFILGQLVALFFIFLPTVVWGVLWLKHSIG